MGLNDKEQVDALHARYGELKEALGQIIVGQDEVIEQLLVAIFCKGHALLVGVPGLAKTLLVSSIAEVLDLKCNRIQFTPDLMPTDITGTDVLDLDQETGRRAFRFVKGPVFANMVLADEINRTPPKTQAALLQAMQEQSVTAGERVLSLPRPFFVLATQNPIEQDGTYVLPEAQLDRFSLQIVVNYPTEEEEKAIIRRVTSPRETVLRPLMSAKDIIGVQELATRVPAAEHVVEFASKLVRATRPTDRTAPNYVKEMVSWGAGPRAGIALIAAAKAHAIINGRYHANTHDVESMALPVLRHRVLTTFSAEAAGVGSAEIVNMLLSDLERQTV